LRFLGEAGVSKDMLFFQDSGEPAFETAFFYINYGFVQGLSYFAGHL
jgi:hypothetical protein